MIEVLGHKLDLQINGPIPSDDEEWQDVMGLTTNYETDEYRFSS